ncbi:hypothetical protein BH11ACT5_BH11ACT5_01800 [soil metagenome]
MSATNPAPRSRLHNLATLASSLLIAFPLLVSSVVKAALFAGNPAKVDITNGLAYLRELLGFGFGSLGLIVLVIVVLFVLAYRQSRSLDALKLPLLILVVQIVAGIAILLFTAISNNAHDNYVTLIGG